MSSPTMPTITLPIDAASIGTAVAAAGATVLVITFAWVIGFGLVKKLTRTVSVTAGADYGHYDADYDDRDDPELDYFHSDYLHERVNHWSIVFAKDMAAEEGFQWENLNPAARAVFIKQAREDELWQEAERMFEADNPAEKWGYWDEATHDHYYRRAKAEYDIS